MIPFLIQFFTNLAADPSGYGQGQTLVGAEAVTTDSSGDATINLEVPGGVAANGWITATATNESTGDTSEFSLGITAAPVSVEFATAYVTVDSIAEVATIEVQRAGNLSAAVSVNYATSNGTAIAGTDYVAASGTLTFLAGQVQQSFAVTILPDTSQRASTTTVILSLSQPTDGATLGSIATAVLTINELPGPPPPPLDIVAPEVTGEQLTVTGRAITSVTIAFSKALNPNRATDLSNYGYYVYSEGGGEVAGGTYTALSAAVYNSTTDTVTLYPAAPLPLNQFFQITVDGQASPLLNNGLIDLAGNQLLGSSGARGTPLYLTVGAGSKLAYTDSGHNAVSLQLKKGGVMEMFLSPLGVVEQLQLVGTVPAKSTLSGSVHRGRGGTGRTVLPTIGGSAGVRIRLKTPPFFIRATSPADANVAARPAAGLELKSRAAFQLARRRCHA